MKFRITYLSVRKREDHLRLIFSSKYPSHLFSDEVRTKLFEVLLFRRPYIYLLGMQLQHITRAVVHQQAVIGAHRERMQYPHRSNLANSSSSGRSTSIVTPCDEPPPAAEESLPTAITTYSVIAASTAIATSSAIAN